MTPPGARWRLQGHFGKAATITDGAPPRRSRSLRRLLLRDKDIRTMCFPKGSPHPNAVEKCRNLGRRMPPASEHYGTLPGMRRAVSAYCRTARLNPELLKYADRKIESARANL